MYKKRFLLILWATIRVRLNNLVAKSIQTQEVCQLHKLVLEQQKELERLSDKETLLNSILDSVAGIHWWKDLDGVYRGCNQAMLDTLELKSKDNIIGKTDYELPWKGQADMLVANDQIVIKTGKIQKGKEELVQTPDGVIHTFMVAKAPLRNAAGDVIGSVGNSIDITKQKQLEKEITIAKESAEVANHAKNQFLANMEHDLRTPCAGIAQMLGFLVTQETRVKQKHTLRLVKNASDYLLDLLNGVLDFNNISNGETPLLYESFNIRKLLEYIMFIQQPQANSKNIEFTSKCSAEVPVEIISDKFRVQRILLNLVSNALKFTEKGFVRIEVSTEKSAEPDHIVIKFVVRDSGIGIAKHESEEIFDRFFRVSASNREKYKGSGLGLHIAKYFSYELNGNIEVDSEIGHGSVFTCTILCKKNSHRNEESSLKNKKLDYKKRNVKILLVEDNELIRLATSAIVNRHLLNKLDEATTGAEAIELATNNDYDLIFMDIGLPDLSGYAVAEQIKQLKKYSKNPVTVIALTAHNKAFAEEDSIKSGMDDIIVKPITNEKITQILDKWIN